MQICLNFNAANCILLFFILKGENKIFRNDTIFLWTPKIPYANLEVKLFKIEKMRTRTV